MIDFTIIAAWRHVFAQFAHDRIKAICKWRYDFEIISCGLVIGTMLSAYLDCNRLLIFAFAALWYALILIIVSWLVMTDRMNMDTAEEDSL